MRYTDATQFELKELETYPVTGRKKRDVPWSKECDDVFSFDIEVTSGWMKEDGEVIGYYKGEPEDFWNSLLPLAIPYHWQFSYNEQVFVGREIRSFEDVLKKFPKDTHIIIWVHNLPYEFQFLCNFLHFEQVFARNPHKPITAIAREYPNIEFRCSYSLTRLSLDSWGKELGLPKLHTLDYDAMRTPKTPMTEEEMEYCVRDCEVVFLGITDMLKRYNHVERIPLTQTGCVRRELKARVNAVEGLSHLLIKLLPRNAYMYSLMRKVFCGGYTHANYLLAGWNVGAGNQYDFASSYPYVMVSEKFPMTPFCADEFDYEKIDKLAYMMKVRFCDIDSITANHYISSSKCDEIEGGVFDNGRLISADLVEMWMTEQDYDIIKKTYSFGFEQVLECYSSKKGYLPKVYIDYILQLYANKTMFKGVEGKEDIYVQSKQFINSIFGMSVTDLLQDEVDFDGQEWYIKPRTVEDVEEMLLDLKKRNKGRTFIAYQWGPWITAYARYNLWECIIPIDQSVIYCDTDSIKMVGDYDFSWYNEKVDQKLKHMCEVMEVDFSLTRPKTPKGVEKPLGYFSKEEPFTEFKTLGAKRYIYRDEESGELKLTISGINKAAVECLGDDIENFQDGFVFDKDAESVTKKYHTYLANMPHIIWKKGEEDEYKSDLSYGINMRPTGYKLSITEEYSELIDLEAILNGFNGKDMVTRLSCI